MKTFLKQYLLTWAKFLVMTPGLVFINFSNLITNLYSLFSATLLGDGKSFDDILNDILERMQP